MTIAQKNHELLFSPPNLRDRLTVVCFPIPLHGLGQTIVKQIQARANFVRMRVLPNNRGISGCVPTDASRDYSRDGFSLSSQWVDRLDGKSVVERIALTQRVVISHSERFICGQFAIQLSLSHSTNRL